MASSVRANFGKYGSSIEAADAPRRRSAMRVPPRVHDRIFSILPIENICHVRLSEPVISGPATPCRESPDAQFAARPSIAPMHAYRLFRLFSPTFPGRGAGDRVQTQFTLCIEQ